jgi:hypothetical protein
MPDVREVGDRYLIVYVSFLLCRRPLACLLSKQRRVEICSMYYSGASAGTFGYIYAGCKSGLMYAMWDYAM